MITSVKEMKRNLLVDGLGEGLIVKNRYRDVGRRVGVRNLSDTDKAEIAALAALGNGKDVAAERGISEQQVSNISTGRSGDVVEEGAKKIKRLKKRSIKTIDRLMDRLNDGMMIPAIEDPKVLTSLMGDLAGVSDKLQKSEERLLDKRNKSEGNGDSSNPMVGVKVVLNSVPQKTEADYEIVEVEPVQD